MSALRLRLAFDYPPPLLPVARMCWFLLQPEHCRVVADLESIIRQRFGFSSRTRLHLFVDGCLLPPNESVQLVRDNDCVRVQQEELITENGFVNSNSPDRPSVKLKKRHRQQSTDKHETQSESGHKKRRRVAGLSSEQRDNSTAETVPVANGEGLKKRKKTENEGNYNIQKKHKKKKDKSSKDQTSRDCSNKRARPGSLEKVLSEPTAIISLSKQGEGRSASNNCSSQRKVRAQAMDSKNLSCSTSENDHPLPKNPQLATVGTITKSKDKDSSAKRSPNSRNGKRPVQPNITTEMAESSSDSLSSDPETPMVKKTFTLKPGTLSSVERISGLSNTGDPNTARSSYEASSDSENSELGKSESKPTGADAVTLGKADNKGHQATTAVLQLDQVGNRNFGQGNGKGRGRGFGGFPWRGQQQCSALRGRGRGAGIFHYNYECSQETKPGEPKDTVTNTHVIVENLPEVPKKDYSKLPLLAAPPQVGERIAFKVLELSANYTPELSDYKEGRLLSYNPVTEQVELCVDSIPRESPKEPGKFDLIYQTETGEDMVEYAVTNEPQITERWSSLVEPRLIVTPAVQ